MSAILVVPTFVSVAAAGASGKTPIPIGVICSCTGPQASGLQASPPGLVAWVDEQNSHGGINGHPIHLYQADDLSDPATSLAEVEKMVAEDHITALVDFSLEPTAWSSYVTKNHVPVVGGQLGTELFFTDADFFPEGMTYDNLETSIALAAKSAGVKKLALLYCAESSECSALAAPMKTAANAAGIQMVYTAAISSSAPDYTAQCLAAKQAGADGIFDAEASSVITTVAGDCSKQGYNPVELANDGSISTSFPTSPGMSGMAGVTLDIPFFVKSTPAAKAMYAAFNKYQPSILTSPNFGDPTSTAYVSGLLFGAAAKAGGVGAHRTPTAKQVIAGLYKLKGATLGGMAPALTYHRNKPNSIKCYFKLSIQGGKFTLPDGTKTSCT